jgi:hypothetical protein
MFLDMNFGNNENGFCGFLDGKSGRVCGIGQQFISNFYPPFSTMDCFQAGLHAFQAQKSRV